MSYYRDQRLRQLRVEVEWLKNKIATKKLTQKNIAEYLHQIKEREYNIALGIFNNNK